MTGFSLALALAVFACGALGGAAIVKIIDTVAARRHKATPFLENEQDWGR